MGQVSIVGAGPVGLTLAAELARYGVPVQIIDRSRHATETSKALVIWSRTLQLMDRMGHASFGDIARRYNFALMVPQSETERLLTVHLEALGVTVQRGVELLDFMQTGSHVQARLRQSKGERPVVQP